MKARYFSQALSGSRPVPDAYFRYMIIADDGRSADFERFAWSQRRAFMAAAEIRGATAALPNGLPGLLGLMASRSTLIFIITPARSSLFASSLGLRAERHDFSSSALYFEVDIIDYIEGGLFCHGAPRHDFDATSRYYLPPPLVNIDYSISYSHGHRLDAYTKLAQQFICLPDDMPEASRLIRYFAALPLPVLRAMSLPSCHRRLVATPRQLAAPGMMRGLLAARLMPSLLASPMRQDETDDVVEKDKVVLALALQRQSDIEPRPLTFASIKMAPPAGYYWR